MKKWILLVSLHILLMFFCGCALVRSEKPQKMTDTVPSSKNKIKASAHKDSVQKDTVDDTNEEAAGNYPMLSPFPDNTFTDPLFDSSEREDCISTADAEYLCKQLKSADPFTGYEYVYHTVGKVIYENKEYFALRSDWIIIDPFGEFERSSYTGNKFVSQNGDEVYSGLITNKDECIFIKKIWSKGEPIGDATLKASAATNDIGNPFFFQKGVSKIPYHAVIAMLEADWVRSDVNLIVTDLGPYRNGKLYNLKIDITDTELERKLTEMPGDRESNSEYFDKHMNLGNLYVEAEKMIKLPVLDEYGRPIAPESYITCQEEELKDVLPDRIKDWHKFIKIDGDKRESLIYNTAVETGYYEQMTWEKGVGLVHYRSGFGAGREEIELTRIS